MPDTTPAADKPHLYLTAVRQQATHAHAFTKAGRIPDALEHVAAIERLLAAYRAAIGAQQTAPTAADRATVERVADALREHGMVHANDPDLADEYDCCAEAAIDELRRTAVEAQS